MPPPRQADVRGAGTVRHKAATGLTSLWRRLSAGGSALVWLGLITAIAFVARIWRLTAVGFRGDEAVYAGQAGLLAGVPGMGRWFIPASRGNSNFLIYQWIVSLIYRGFGVSDYSARLVSVVFSTLTVVIVYLIGALLYGRATGLLSALVIAISGYAIGLGRLALLDTTACFFIAAAMYCLAKWANSDRMRWLALFVAATAVAIQVKVTCVLVVPIAVLFVLLGGYWRRLRIRGLAWLLGLGLLCLAPALAQIAANSGNLRAYLGATVSRTSGVPWDYYPHLLWTAEGVVLSVVMLAGVVITLVRREPQDLLPLLWFGGYALFCQLYPLKAFNYLLPLIPPLALLAGRALAWLAGLVARRVAVAAMLPVAALALVVLAVQLPAVQRAVHDDSDAGMREAALWLRDHNAQRAGAMALSHGSGQYVLSFYGGVDSYPFGRFRIATVVPGGRIVQTSERTGNAVPLDWVDRWPVRLVETGRVSYLVYNTRPLDDPPEEDQVAGTITEREFRALIPAFGGTLVHTVYWHHEARVYIYRVTKRLPKPAVSVSPSGTGVRIQARGFVIGSALTFTYHQQVVARAAADGTGAATITLPVPDPGQREYHVTVTDAEGNSAATTGLPQTKVVYSVEGGYVHVAGSGYAPASEVRFSYGTKALGSARASADGSVSFVFRLPVTTHKRFRIKAIDDLGRTASATGLQPPYVAFVARDHRVDLAGKYYFPKSTVKVIYHQHVVGIVQTDDQGAFRLRFDLPKSARSVYQLTATDALGRSAGVTGLVQS